MLRAVCFPMFALSVELCAPALAGARTFSVGSGCPYSDLQQAVDAAPTSGGEIHLLRNLTNQHVDIAGKSLAIIGGFAACADATPVPGATNIVSAGSHTNDSVITISGVANVLLKNLTISDGKENDAGYGGGIDVVGHGSLVLDNVQVTDNRAGYGGGINVSPNGAMVLRLQNGTSIANNTGTISGGGIRVEGDTRLYMIDGTATIVGNTALGPNDGHGGGLQVIGPAFANIGSGRILGNNARYGGGISAESNSHGPGVVQLFRTSPYFPATVGGNKATRSGGGIFLVANPDWGSGRLCGFGYEISNNVAQEGTAIYDDTSNENGSRVFLVREGLTSNSCALETPASLGAMECPIDQPCNTIDSNVAQTSDGSATGGAAILMQSGARLSMEAVQISRNHGGYALRSFSDSRGDPSDLSGCVVDDNTLTQGVVRTQEGGSVTMRGCTVAENIVTNNGSVFSVDGRFTLAGSLLWQPGLSLLAPGWDTLTVGNVMANDVSTLGGGRPDVVAVTDPRFKNPAQRNYRLTPASPAVDFAVPPAGTGDFDFDHRPRIVGLSRPDRPLDLGAYELQSLVQFPPDETFDELSAPSPPDGWANVRTGGGTKFFTVTNFFTSAPNALYTDDPATVSNKLFWTPEFSVVAKGRVTFRQKVVLEAGDGIRLEIAIGAGQLTFHDIIEAGGSFVAGAYNATVPENGNPLHSARAWSGDSGGFQTVTVNLPREADGQPVKLRWHMGTDAGGGYQPSWGYWLDDIHVDLDGRVTDRVFCDGLDGVPCE